MAGARALEEVVQFLLLFYRLFWPEENWYSRWARRESLVFVPFLKLRMPPFFVELPCHTLLFRLFELPPLLHVASSFPLRANKSDCRLLTIQYTITICLQASGETAVTKVTLFGLAPESAFCCQILHVQASDWGDRLNSDNISYQTPKPPWNLEGPWQNLRADNEIRNTETPCHLAKFVRKNCSQWLIANQLL